jgi:hypothetical protein
MACPNIDRSIERTSYMEPIAYGGYVYWRRMNPDGVIENVQFCKKIGRKKDVFECLNECEYKACYAYKLSDEA